MSGISNASDTIEGGMARKDGEESIPVLPIGVVCIGGNSWRKNRRRLMLLVEGLIL